MNHEAFWGRRRTAVVVLSLTLIAGAAVGSIATLWATAPSPAGRGIPIFVSRNKYGGAGERVSFEAGFSPVVKRAVPAVVSIASTKVVRTPGQYLPFFSNPLFRQFFGNHPRLPREQREQSLGSGVIVSPDGYVITNNHVVDGATDIKVSLSDGREFAGHIVGRDPQTDIAVLRVDAKGLPTLPFGDSSRMSPGDFVLAIGNPFGLSHTVTMGIVSATGRVGLDIEDYEDFIQTDAAINPGNSGGALINVDGALIGINTAILSGGQTGGNEGIGFAIPTNMARQVMDQILKKGKVVRGYMGIYIQNVTPSMAKAFGVSTMRGALIGDVTPGSPASRAGLQRGDIILDANGKTVVDASQFRLETAMTPPGTTMRLTVLRNGNRMAIPVTLGEMPSQPNAESGAAVAPGSAFQGMTVARLTPELARELHLPAGTQGVVISRLSAASPAREAGLDVGDVIREVDRKPVNSVAGFDSAARAAGNRPVLLLVERGGATMFVVVRP